MDIHKAKKLLVKAYHECIYQRKVLDRPMEYYRGQIQKINNKPKPLSEDDKEEINKLRKELMKYGRQTKNDYRDILNVEECVVHKILVINIRLRKPYDNMNFE